MKSMMLIPFFLMINFVHADNAMAGSLRATAEKLTRETTQIGYTVAVLGLVLSGIYMVIGKQDATQRATICLLGTLTIWCATSLVDFVKTVA